MDIADAASILIEAARHDLRVREELVRSGELATSGYHPRMEAVHRRNADLLKAVLAQHGWPDAARFTAEAAEAAWLIAQHAIGDPPLQRQALAALRAVGESRQAAMLEDRIACLEGRPQRYGTQHDWDEAGQLSPAPIDDPDQVDARRAAIGLEPLSERSAALRAEAKREGRIPPPDFEERQREFREWAKRTGWR